MRLANPSPRTVIEPKSDLPYPSLQRIESPEISVKPSATPENASEIAPSPDLDASEFLPERPGPAWMWEFGVMG